MNADILGIVTGVLAIIGAFVKLYIKHREDIAKLEDSPDEHYAQDIAEVNEAVVSGDSDKLSAMFDELRAPPDNPNNRDPVRPDGADFT